MDYIEPNKHIVFNDGKTDYSLSVNDILYITKDDRKTLIVTSNREYSIYISMVKMSIRAKELFCFLFQIKPPLSEIRKR